MNEELEKKKPISVVFTIIALALLVNASLVNILIGLECVVFNPDKEFLKYTNYLAFFAIAGVLDNHIGIRNIINKVVGNKLKISK